MNSKECEKQLQSLIEHFNNGGQDFNTRDVEAIKHILLENQLQHDKINELKIKLSAREEINKNAIERLESLIIFWKKYNPVDNHMQVEQFNGVIDILNGGTNDNVNRTIDYI